METLQEKRYRSTETGHQERRKKLKLTFDPGPAVRKANLGIKRDIRHAYKNVFLNRSSYYFLRVIFLWNRNA